MYAHTHIHIHTSNVFILFLLIFDCNNKHINATNTHECLCDMAHSSLKNTSINDKNDDFYNMKDQLLVSSKHHRFSSHVQTMHIDGYTTQPVWNQKTKQTLIFPKLRCAYNHSAKSVQVVILPCQKYSTFVTTRLRRLELLSLYSSQLLTGATLIQTNKRFKRMLFTETKMYYYLLGLFVLINSILLNFLYVWTLF